MDFKMYFCSYIIIVMHVMDSIEGRGNGPVHELRPENARLLELEPEQKHDMMVGMERLRPEEDGSTTANSNSGDSEHEQINWLTQVKQYVSKLVMVSKWIPQNNVVYHVTKVVNFWNYNPRLTVVKISMSSNDSDDDSNDNGGGSSEDSTSGWIGMTNNHLLEDDSKAAEIVEKAENLVGKFDSTGMLMRRMILPASGVPREKRSLPVLGGLLETTGDLVDGVIGTVLGIGTGKKGAVGGGTSVDGNVDARARHKRSLMLI